MDISTYNHSRAGAREFASNKQDDAGKLCAVAISVAERSVKYVSSRLGEKWLENL